MTFQSMWRGALVAIVTLGLSGCGGSSSSPETRSASAQRQLENSPQAIYEQDQVRERGSGSIWDLFGRRDDPSTTVAVNKYLWQASLEILNFLPIESVDPFSGVIVTGYGVPPGGSRAYRATIYVQDPALEARSLKVALYSKGGAVDAQTVRAVEDAILTRARQIRLRDTNL
jgi:hypothetical protein